MDSLGFRFLIKIYTVVEVVIIRNFRRIFCISRLCRLYIRIRISFFKTFRIFCIISYRYYFVNRIVSFIIEIRKFSVYIR